MFALVSEFVLNLLDEPFWPALRFGSLVFALGLLIWIICLRRPTNVRARAFLKLVGFVSAFLLALGPLLINGVSLMDRCSFDRLMLGVEFSQCGIAAGSLGADMPPQTRELAETLIPWLSVPFFLWGLWFIYSEWIRPISHEVRDKDD